jgi:hypothetical protein
MIIEKSTIDFETKEWCNTLKHPNLFSLGYDKDMREVDSGIFASIHASK